jgi:ribonuclease-3
MFETAEYLPGESIMTDERLSALMDLQKRLSYPFRDISLLDNALIHRSYINENPTLSLKDNERLEFLGDAVIGLCTSDILMKKYPGYTEGRLSKMRASIVNEYCLAKLAKKYRIGDCLLLGKGEEHSGGRAKTSILSDAFEAVTAAVFLDSCFDHVYEFIKTGIEALIEEGDRAAIYSDYKTAAQEICQTLFKDIPKYTLTGTSGPDHDKLFEVSFSLAGVITTTGTGKSKKEAEQQAAKKAIEALNQDGVKTENT